MQKVKVNFSLRQETKDELMKLHKETGLSHGVIIDYLISKYGCELPKIFKKEE